MHMRTGEIMETKVKPFIPRDKPRSWVVFILSVLTGLLLASPMMFIGRYLYLELISSVGEFIFSVCWTTGFIFLSVFIFSMLSGKYRNITEQDWGKQRW